MCTEYMYLHTKICIHSSRHVYMKTTHDMTSEVIVLSQMMHVYT